MRQPRAAVRRVMMAALAGLLLLVSWEPAQAEVRLSIEDSRRMAVAMVQGGQPLAARAAALALLDRDPDDLVALLVLARAARDLGFYDEAKAAARRAHSVAPKGSADRFGASLAMAQALASGGQRGMAQIWLRRAASEAPDDKARAVALRDLAYVRWRNPLSVQLRFNAFPSSNINGGPTSNVLVIGGFEFVDPTAVPLSGFGVSTGADLAYRLIDGEERLTLGFAVDATRYALSDRARALVPTARDKDYATSQVQLSLRWDSKRDWGVMSAFAGLGRDWRGGEPLADWARLGLAAKIGYGEAGVLDLSVDVTERNRLDLPLRSSRELGVDAGWTWILSGGDTVRVGVDLTRVWSDAATVSRRSARAEVQWRKAEPVMGLGLSAFGSVAVTDYDLPLFLLGVQHDVSAELGLMTTVQSVDILGFAPEVGIVLSRTKSNIAAMTTESAEVRLGIRSLY
jgi:tetratricopeptide (TPR) repeat protein